MYISSLQPKVSINNKSDLSKKSFGFCPTKEQAKLLGVLIQKAPHYSEWIEQGIKASIKDNDADSLLRDSYMSLGLSKACRIMEKENQANKTNKDYFHNLAVSYRIKANMLFHDSKRRALVIPRPADVFEAAFEIIKPKQAPSSDALLLFG